MRRRRGENQYPGEHHVRTDRLVETGNGWYFRTREGIDVGPYPTKFDAELCASLLIARLAQLEPGTDYQLHIRAFIADPAHAPGGREIRSSVLDLQALREANRRRRRLAQARRAWETVINTVHDGTEMVRRGFRRVPPH